MARTLMARIPWLFFVTKSLGKNPIAADLEYFRVIFFFYIQNGILCVLIRIVSMRQF